MRQREIDALKGDGSDVAATPQAKTLISQTETLPVPEWPIVEEFIPIVTQPADGVPALPK